MTAHETHTAGTPEHEVPATMRAIVQERYGTPDVLELRTVETPEVPQDRVLVEVRASSLNMYDWHMTTATPYMIRLMTGLTKPKRSVPGADVAGVVVAVGAGVDEFSVGDEVFGSIGAGAWAEYAVANPRALARKPKGVSFEQAAAVPMAGMTALQGLRDHGGIEPGKKVLINGASGGVGTFAVQLAKALGAEVTAVCSTSKVDMVRSLGADRVIDYTRDDFAATERDYDLLFDNVGDRPWSQTSSVLSDDGVNVTITGPKNAVLGPVRALQFRKLLARFSSKRMVSFTAGVRQSDLEVLGGMLSDGSIEAVIETTFPLERAPEALAYLGEGHARGKVVIVA